MTPEEFKLLNERLTSIEAEIRAVRKVLGLYAPAPPPKQVASARARLEDVSFDFDNILRFLECPCFLALRGASKRFLAILGFLHMKHPLEFSRLEEIRGGERVYFSKSKHEIELSGSSTKPKEIPGSPWFVVTNNPTERKIKIATQACRLLGYSPGECIAVSQALDPEAPVSIELERSFNSPVDDTNGLQI